MVWRERWAPPVVDDIQAASLRDVPRLVWWQLVGFAYGARHGQPRSRLISGGSLFWAVLFSPVLLGVQLGQVLSRNTHWYATADAALALSRSRKGWTLHSHMSARPGSGAGQLLREVVMPAVLERADREHVTIYGAAADARLAGIYCAEIPGMRVTGKALLRGVRLRRDPAGADVSPESSARRS